jgi:hypothetical protein
MHVLGRAVLGQARRGTLVLCALALGTAGLAVGIAGPAGAAPPYQFCNPGSDPLCVPLQITPSSGLTDGQVVQVVSTGNVLPSITYQVEECLGLFDGTQAYPASDCPEGGMIYPRAKQHGSPDDKSEAARAYMVVTGWAPSSRP